MERALETRQFSTNLLSDFEASNLSYFLLYKTNMLG